MMMSLALAAVAAIALVFLASRLFCVLLVLAASAVMLVV